MKRFLFLLTAISTGALAADPEFLLVIRDHRFQPAELTVPAGTRVKLRIENQDVAAEEFESYTLHREKIVPGKGSALIFIGPLSPGRYPFFGEFHEKTAEGVIIAK